MADDVRGAALEPPPWPPLFVRPSLPSSPFTHLFIIVCLHVHACKQQCCQHALHGHKTSQTEAPEERRNESRRPRPLFPARWWRRPAASTARSLFPTYQCDAHEWGPHFRVGWVAPGSNRRVQQQRGRTVSGVSATELTAWIRSSNTGRVEKYRRVCPTNRLAALLITPRRPS